MPPNSPPAPRRPAPPSLPPAATALAATASAAASAAAASAPALVSRKRFRDQAHVTNQHPVNQMHLTNGAAASYRADFLPSRNIPAPAQQASNEVSMRDLVPHDDEELLDEMDIPPNVDAPDHVNMLAHPRVASQQASALVTREDAVFVPFYPHLLGSDFDDSDLL